MNDENTIKLFEKLSDISERLAKVETMLAERTKATAEIIESIEQHEERITHLEQDTTKVFVAKNVVVWGIATIIALAGVVQWTK